MSAQRLALFFLALTGRADAGITGTMPSALLHCRGTGEEEKVPESVLDVWDSNRYMNGWEFACALDATDAIVCWGKGAGASGAPAGTFSYLPPTAHTFGCAIKTDSTVACWPLGNSRDELVNDVPPDAVLNNQLRIGNSQACIVTTSNAVKCWGKTWDDLLVIPPSLGTVTALAAGYYHTCALKTDNSVECWGRNEDGRLEVPTGMGAVATIASQQHDTCALTQTNEIYCWGENYPSSGATRAPPVGPQTGVEQILFSSGGDCFLKDTNEFDCWHGGPRGSWPSGSIFYTQSSGRNGQCIYGIVPTTTTTTLTKTTATATTATTVSSTTSTSRTSTVTTSTTSSSSSSTSSTSSSSTSSSSTSTSSSSSSSTTSTTLTTSTTSSSSSSTSSSSTSSSSSSSSSTSSSTLTTSSTSSSSSTTSSSSTSSSSSSTSSTSTTTLSTTTSSTTTSSTTTSSTSSSSSSSTTTSSSSSSSTSTTTSSSSSSSTTSSSTSSTTEGTNGVERWIGDVEESRAGLFRDLGQGGGSVAAEQKPWGFVAMTRPGLLASQAQQARAVGQRQVAMTPLEPLGKDLEIRFPVEMLLVDFAEELPRMQAVAAIANETSLFSVVQGNVATTVLGVLFLDLRLPGRGLNVSGLMEPIELMLPVKYRRDLLCAYWDEEADDWSTEGVEVSNQSVVGAGMWCKTYHLSVFGAILRGIVQTLLCANFDLLNSAALRSLLEGEWYMSPGAVLNWCMLAFWAGLFGAATCVDLWRQRRFHWKDAYFVLELAPAPVEEAPQAPEATEASEAAEVAEAAATGKASLFGGGCLSCLMSEAFREAVDDIVSRWFAWFSQLRAFGELCWEALDGGSMAVNIGQLLEKLTAHVLLLTSKRLTSTSVGISSGVVDYILNDEDVLKLLMEEHEHTTPEEAARQVAPGRAGEWRSHMQGKEAWRLLHDEVCHHVLHHTQPRGCLRTVLQILRSSLPFTEIFLWDIFASCKQKVLALAVEVQGAFMLACVFFVGAGMIKGKATNAEGCDDEEEEGGDFGTIMGRFIVIGVASMLFASLPLTFLESLQTKGLKKVAPGRVSRQLRAWRIQEAFFWAAGLSYLAFCSFFVLLFLANVGKQDNEEWSVAGASALAEDMLVGPMSSALAVPLMGRCLLCGHSRVSKVPERQVVRQAQELMHNSCNMMLPITHA